MNGLDLLKDMDLIDEAVIEKNTQPPQRKLPARWLLPIAACLAVLLAGRFLPRPQLAPPDITSTLTSEAPPATISPEPSYAPMEPTYPALQTFDATENPTQINGVTTAGEMGSVSSGFSSELAPPTFRFSGSDMVITAKVTEILPDVYYALHDSFDYSSVPYRLLRIEVLSTLWGENVPEEILYLLPEENLGNMTAFDILVMAIRQHNCENSVLININQGQMEQFPLLFWSSNYDPVGNIIAFTDGEFDESLWERALWYGAEVHYFDYGEIASLKVSSLSGLLDNLQTLFNEQLDAGKQPGTVKYLKVQTDAAKQLLEAMNSFENGVFVPKFGQADNLEEIVFHRYVGGIRTNETITLDLLTEKITYSDTSFTQEELTTMPDIPGYLKQLDAAIAEGTLLPPRVDPEGKKLVSCGAEGWYIKTEHRIYGIVQTNWIYQQQAEEELVWYKDAEYTLLDAHNGVLHTISCEELNTLLGEDRFSDADCAHGFVLPTSYPVLP